MPVYINPEKKDRVDCPLCEFYQAIKIGNLYKCLGNDNTCNFEGTLEDVEKLKRERDIDRGKNKICA